MIVSPVQKKRDRVSKACQFCRKKKIKCDGNQPCGNCSSANSECIYPSESERKPRSKKAKPSKSQSISDLDNRLARLESLLTNLAGKMDGGNLGLFGTSVDDALESTIDSKLETPGNSEISPNSIANEGIPYSNFIPNVEGDYEKSTAESGYSLNAPTAHVTEDQMASQALTTNVFHGNHSCFFIFSGKSMEWIASKVPPIHQDSFVPLGNLPTLFSICVKAFNEVWFSPRPTDAELRKQMSLGWFPEDEKLIFELLEGVGNIFLVNEIYDSNHLTELFKIYYTERDSKSGSSYRFRFSELLIMNICLALAISHVIDNRIVDNMHSVDISSTSRLASCSTKDLVTLQTKFFSNSIYYYDMVSVMSDGLRTIQGILLLISYLETSWVKNHVNYILVSIAVRYAQEIGLHRSETLIGLSAEEAHIRRRIWWFCEYYDMEICYRMGKPPLVNPSDVSTLNTKDLINSSFNGCSISDVNEVDDLNPEFLKCLLERRGFTVYLCHFITHLNRIRYDSYTGLFSASSSVNSLGNLVTKIDSLNTRMFRLANSLSASLRPRFYRDSDFSSLFIFRNKVEDIQTLEMAVTFHLTYFTHLMTINRVVSRLDIHDQGPGNVHIQKFRNLGLESARTILHIVSNIDSSLIPYSCLNWLLIYPFGAFLTLTASCLNRPSQSQTLEDVNLLINVIMLFFGASSFKMEYEAGDNSFHRFYNQRESAIFMICTLILTVGIRIIDSKSTFNIYETNPSIKQMNDICRHICPELYQKIPIPQKPSESHSSTSNSTQWKPIADEYASDMSNKQSSSSTSINNDSPFFIPASVLPGPTGYLSTKFDSPGSLNESDSLQNLLAGNKVENLQELSSPGTLFSVKNQQPGFTFLTGNEFNENLERILGGEINFFFDNNVGV